MPLKYNKKKVGNKNNSTNKNNTVVIDTRGDWEFSFEQKKADPTS